ncbi:unnamed protein product [Meloidogyne enterolobii]|uniref:Uncharacterized protein n=1 Tax=Meloidogyne enterolobii TaxID=390850 RepID=A0ACB0ZJS8_MELEN
MGFWSYIKAQFLDLYLYVYLFMLHKRMNVNKNRLMSPTFIIFWLSWLYYTMLMHKHTSRGVWEIKTCAAKNKGISFIRTLYVQVLISSIFPTKNS